MVQQNVIRIAMLNTDLPVASVHAKLGTYGSIFHNLLSATVARIAPHIAIESTDFDVTAGEYPASISQFDAILVTGSAASAYDKVDWIYKLDNYVAFVYNNHPSVKMFGSCFGHQLICQSVLRKYGAFVEKDPKGWELGVQEIQLTDEFRLAVEPDKAATRKGGWEPKRRPPTPDSVASQPSLPESLRLQFVHADHVRLPSAEALPEAWMTIGSTSHCAVQGVYEPGRILTYQGHFEFDRFVNMETLKVFGALWDPELLRKGLQSMDTCDDAELATELVVRFLMEPVVEVEMDQGIVTPPLEA